MHTVRSSYAMDPRTLHTADTSVRSSAGAANGWVSTQHAAESQGDAHRASRLAPDRETVSGKENMRSRAANTNNLQTYLAKVAALTRC